MNTEEMQELLYGRMFMEQAGYHYWRLNQPPEKILNHAYQYSVRQNFLAMVEICELPDSQIKALLKSKTPLEDLYSIWEVTDTNDIEALQRVIESCANAVMRRKAEKIRQEEW